MTSCCPRRRMRWSGATGAIARCKNRSTGYGRKHRSVHAWRWTCGAKPKAKDANKPSTPYMRHVLPEATRYPCYSLELIRTYYDEIVKYTTALKLGTADAEAILSRFTKNGVKHPAYQAVLELGKVRKTIFLCQYLNSAALRQEIEEGL